MRERIPKLALYAIGTFDGYIRCPSCYKEFFYVIKKKRRKCKKR